MPHLLLGGVPEGVATWLRRELPGVHVERAATGGGVLARLSERRWDALLLDGSIPDPGGLEVLAERPREACPAVFYVVRTAGDAAALREAVGTLGIRRLLVHPLQPADLLARLAEVLPSAAPGRSTANLSLSGLWGRHQDLHATRAETLARAARAAVGGTLDEALREQARLDAQRLAGALGTFGIPEGARLAREAADLLAHPVPGEEAPLALARLALRLQELVREGPAPVEGQAESGLLWLGPDPRQAAGLRAKAAEMRIGLTAPRSLAEARALLARQRPAGVVVDLDAPGADLGALLDLVEELAGSGRPLPILALVEDGPSSHRGDALRRGASGTLRRGSPPEALLDALLRLRDRLEARMPARVLAVNEDPAVQSLLADLLEPLGIQVVPLENPLHAWEALEGHRPDLLLLDVDLPHLSGLDLCRLVRQDLSWTGLPIVMLTSEKEPATVERVFAAGADDFVSTPVAGPELVARVRNLLDRFRGLASALDPLTGLARREGAERDLRTQSLLARDVGLPMSVSSLRVEGDADVAAAAAGLLRGRLRLPDVAALWGPREWVVGAFGVRREDLAETLRAWAGDLPEGLAALGGVAEVGLEGLALRLALDEARLRLLEAEAGGPGTFLDSPEGRTLSVDVLVVQGDEGMAGLLVHSLRSKGLRCHLLADGAEALQALLGEPPTLRARLLVLDAELPGMGGQEVLDRLRAAGAVPGTRVIMLTPRASDREAVQAFRSGAFDHVVRPFSLAVLLERIARALDPRA